MKYLLLTGATGLVGRYLLRDLLAADVPVVTIARSTRFETAAERVEAIMRYWEGLAGRCLPRPVVIEGDLRKPMFAMSEQSQNWIAQNCDVVLHNAASMTFTEDKHGEPFVTNVDGMKHMLALCKQAGIREFHHVSTAYVCGLRTGRVYENELDLGQENGNVYEVSKLRAEKMLREQGDFDSVTIYRPASVVGDSATGFTTSSHGFYLPLQLAYVIADKIPTKMMGERYFKLLGMTGNEGKNLVPVDWLSQGIVHMVRNREHHGQTYHMTNPLPVTVQSIERVVQDAIENFSTRRCVGNPTDAEIEIYDELFRQHMDVYRSHWRDDPKFDRTNTDRALAHLPCPEIDHDMLVRIASYPIKHNFVLRRMEPKTEGFQAREHLERLAADRGPGITATAAELASGQTADTVGLQITGNGGGQWRLVVRDGQLVGIDMGLGPADRARYYLNSSTFSSLVEGRYSVEQSLKSGRVVIEGQADESADCDLVGILKDVVAAT